jgi:hypothetical protein
MSEVSTFRLYLLRAMYLLMAVGLAIFELPRLLHPENLSRLDSVVLSVLGAVSLLAVLGIRYPLKMLPLLFFEFLWKSIWVLLFGLLLLLAQQLDPGTTETLTACLMGIVLVPLVTPSADFSVIDPYRMMRTAGSAEKSTRPAMFAWRARVSISATRCWGYVLKHYLKAHGDRWGKQVTSSTPTQPSSSPVVSEDRVVTPQANK